MSVYPVTHTPVCLFYVSVIRNFITKFAVMMFTIGFNLWRVEENIRNLETVINRDIQNVRLGATDGDR